MRFGKGDGGVGHRLLVVSPEGWQLGAGSVEGLAEPGDVAVAEDRPHAGEEGRLAPVHVGALRAQVPDERLRELAVKRRLPTMYLYRAHVEAGGLISYGPDLPDMF